MKIMKQIRIQKKYAVVFVSIVCVLSSYIGFRDYANYKHKNSTFKLTECTIKMHTYLFEGAKVGSHTMLELLWNSLQRDSVSIVEFSKIELPYLLPTTDFDSEEKVTLYSFRIGLQEFKNETLQFRTTYTN
jgi:hypothetical protein